MTCWALLDRAAFHTTWRSRWCRALGAVPDDRDCPRGGHGRQRSRSCLCPGGVTSPRRSTGLVHRGTDHGQVGIARHGLSERVVRAYVEPPTERPTRPLSRFVRSAISDASIATVPLPHRRRSALARFGPQLRHGNTARTVVPPRPDMPASRSAAERASAWPFP